MTDVEHKWGTEPTKGTLTGELWGVFHYNDVIMGAIASQITSLTIAYSIAHSDVDQRKHQSSASLAFVREFTGVNSPHKWPVTPKMFPFDNVFILWSFMRKFTALKRHRTVSRVTRYDILRNKFWVLCLVTPYGIMVLGQPWFHEAVTWYNYFVLVILKAIIIIFYSKLKHFRSLTNTSIISSANIMFRPQCANEDSLTVRDIGQ